MATAQHSQSACASNKGYGLSPWTSVTSMLETILDQTTMFEWLKHSQGSTEAPDYLELLEFLDLRA